MYYRKINVSEFYRPITSSSSLCWKPVTSQKYYILFAAFRDNVLVAFNDDTLGAFEEWSAEKEALVWRGLGKIILFPIIIYVFFMNINISEISSG